MIRQRPRARLRRRIQLDVVDPGLRLVAKRRLVDDLAEVELRALD